MQRSGAGGHSRQCCRPGLCDLSWKGGKPRNENRFWGHRALMHPTWSHGGVLQLSWRSAVPSLQQPLEGRRQLPNVSGLYPGTAGLPERMAGPVGPEGLSSSTPGSQLHRHKDVACAQAGKGVLAERALGREGRSQSSRDSYCPASGTN